MPNEIKIALAVSATGYVLTSSQLPLPLIKPPCLKPGDPIELVCPTTPPTAEKRYE